MKFIRKMVKGLLFIAAFCVLGYYMVKYLVPSVGKAPNKELVKQSPYYYDGKFVNTVDTKSADFKQIPSILKRYITRDVESKPLQDYIFKESGKNALQTDTTEQLYVNWLGHAAVLLQKSGRYILLDPMLGERASPFNFMGPKRFFPSPIELEELPAVEALIISHDHYDHLDYKTIITIKHKVKYFYVPLGVKESLLHWGVEEDKIVQMSWWEMDERLDDISIIATPARHFSGRLFSQNNTFWASWVIKWDDQRIYFGGDTGIFDGFGEIDQKLGPFDLSILPIGAYNEAWHDIHMNPEEAIDAFQQMNSGALFPIHWGTFDLALHSWYEPIQLLTDLSLEKKLPLLSHPPGKWFTLKQDSLDYNWWKKYSNEF